MLYVFFWVIPWRLNFICRRFETLCLFHLHRRIGMKDLHTYPPMKVEQSVPKRRHITFRHREITQEKAYTSQDISRLSGYVKFQNSFFKSPAHVLVLSQINPLYALPLYSLKQDGCTDIYFIYRLFKKVLVTECRSQWPCGLRRRSEAARLLKSWVRIPRGHWCLSVVSVVCCEVESVRRADHSSTGVLPTVVRRCVWSRNLKNEEAMTRVGSQRHSKKNKSYRINNICRCIYSTVNTHVSCCVLFPLHACTEIATHL